jgi:hypothetical protein
MPTNSPSSPFRTACFVVCLGLVIAAILVRFGQDAYHESWGTPAALAGLGLVIAALGEAHARERR